MEDGLKEEELAVTPPPSDLRHIFPLAAVHSGWTTAATTHTNEWLAGNKLYPLLLSDSQLGVHRVSSGTTHRLCILSDGFSTAWEAVYKKESFKPSGNVKGGFGFYLRGPQGNWATDLLSSAEAVFSYSVRFQKDFDFMKGGKLPGIFGGEGDKAYNCTGGRQDDRCSCFNLRLMWREDGQGELYAYLPLTQSNKDCLLAIPGSHQNTDYGFSVGRGLFKFTPATWATIAERVKLNDPGHKNGEFQLWIDGESVIDVKGLVLRSTQSALIQGLHFQTFFGGSTSEWASPKEQRAWFSNISGATMTIAK